MRYRKLRIAWSVGCGIACLLLVVLWVSTYWWQSSIRIRMPGYRIVGGISWFGWSSFDYYWENPSTLDDLRSFPMSEMLFHYISDPQPNTAGRGWRWARYIDNQRAVTQLQVPCWFTTLVAAACAVTPWLPWQNRFSLRTLLIATTLVAVVLGLGVWFSR
jgi:hypothetical protein